VNSSASRQHLDLSGKTAVVTGSSRGIGRAIALELAATGANVLVHARRDTEGAEKTAAQIRELGRESKCVLVDLADDSHLKPFVSDTWNWRGVVDIWVNNAGIDVLTGPAKEWSFDKKLAALWQVDVLATVGLSRLVGQRMTQDRNSKTADAGVILNMGWDQATYGMGGESGEIFATTKGAIMAFSRSLAQSLAPSVRVNCLAPGWIQTEWGQGTSDYWNDRACDESLMQRWGTPEDVARLAAFVASPAAAFITGQTLEINGGLRRTD